MSQLRNTQKSMNAGEVRALASTNSFYGMPATYYGPAGERVPVDAPVAGGDTIFDVPELAELIEANEKEGLMQRRDAGELHGNLRRRGRGSEWDHLVMTFSKDESRQLKEMGPEAIAEVTKIIGETMNRGLQNVNQTRQVIVQDMHTNTGNFHVHAVLHRFGRMGDEISTMIDQDRDSEMTDLASNINQALEAAGFDFLKVGDTRRDAPDVDRADPDRIDVDSGMSILANARSMTPDEAQIKKMIERTQRQLEEKRREAEREEQMLEEMQHMLAAKVQVREAEAAKEAAEASQATAEANAAAALEEASQIKDKAAQEVEAAEQAKAQAEAIAQEQQGIAEAAQTKTVELAGELEAEKEAKASVVEDLEAEKEAKAEVVSELEAEKQAKAAALEEAAQAQAENTKLQERLATLESRQAELMAEMKTVRKSAHEMESENLTLRETMEADRAAFSESMKQMAQLRALKMELESDNKSLSEQLSALRDNVAKQIAELRTLLTGSLRDVLKWRREQSPDLAKDDRQTLSDLTKSRNAKKNDNGGSGPKNG